ncbi:MAG: GAF domain-containing protein [Actinomycetota bacterium]
MVKASEQRRSTPANTPPGRAPTRLPDERAYLYQIIQTIGSGPDLEVILRGVVRLATEATGCHACLIWFIEGDRLVLRASSAPYEHLAGVASMDRSEGLVGWVAKTRRSAFIKEGALEDPRVKYFPEFEEERFQSLVSVPMFGRNGEVMGVISLHAEAPHEFVRADLDLLEHTASLIAGAVENARLYEEAAARVALLTDLSLTLQGIAGAPTIEDVFATVSIGTRELLGADRAEIYLTDPDKRLRLRAASPPRYDERVIDTRTLWCDVLRDKRPDGTEGARYLATALWGEEVPGRTMFAPLVAGDERIGLLVVCVPAPIPGADTALSAVAAHTAVTIKQHQLIERLQETNVVKDLFRVLAGEDGRDDELEAMADRLGLDIRAEHLVLHIERSRDPRPAGRRRPARLQPDTEHLGWHDTAGQVRSRLDNCLGAALFDHDDRSLQALITMSDRTPADVLAALRNMDWEDGREAPLSVGVSNVCRGRASFPQGFREAAAAAKVGALIRGKPGVTAYDELGPYRYALSVEGDDERDLFQQRLRLLIEYDRRRGTQLLDTLEGYLDHRGNVVGTSRALFIHPNTLRQRLDRIQRESGIDLEHEDWLSLAVATKVVKLSRMRGSATRERGNDG